MRLILALAAFAVAAQAASDSPVKRLWANLQEKRDHLTAFHQEFEITETFKSSSGEKTSKWEATIDASPTRWLSKTVRGSGTRLDLFDGEMLLSWEDGDSEYTRRTPHKEQEAVPFLYDATGFEWNKAVELERRPCGLTNVNHSCVLLQVPLRARMHANSPTDVTAMRQGIERVLLDLETGLALGARIARAYETPRGGYQSDQNCALKSMSYGGKANESLFRLPSDNMKEVKELSPWNAARIKKQLGGKPAPELAAKDLNGNPVSLSALKGKTVLLDFWTTWCGPCREDAPSIDKLYSKYGGKQLAIIGISVSEDRSVVEKFLKQHPHSYPVVLTSENELPREYQIGVFPTYIVIDADGTLATAIEGERGFADLRSKLKKAGLDTE